MTTTGPFELSGIVAGVSVEGPMASVSARLRLVGGAGFAADVVGGAALGAGSVSEVCGTVIMVGSVAPATLSGTGAVVFAAAGAAPDDGNVFISTGLDDRSSCAFSFSVRDPGVTCGLFCAAADGCSAPSEAMSATVAPSRGVSNDSDCEAPGERMYWQRTVDIRYGGRRRWWMYRRRDQSRSVNVSAMGSWMAAGARAQQWHFPALFLRKRCKGDPLVSTETANSPV